MKLLLALLTLAISSLAADVAGNWNLTAPTKNGGEMKVKLMIRLSGDVYSGTVSQGDDEAALQDVQVKDSVVTFKVDTDEAKYEVTATVDGDSIKGSFTANGKPGAAFSGKRAANSTT